MKKKQKVFEQPSDYLAVPGVAWIVILIYLIIHLASA
jgi:hypothetical protein